MWKGKSEMRVADNNQHIQREERIGGERQKGEGEGREGGPSPSMDVS